MAPDGGSTLSPTLGMSSLYNSPLYSDLKIRSRNGTTYSVHKAIVCSQSQFLANACNPKYGFKEAQEGVIDISEEESAIIEGLLKFLYTHDYPVPVSTPALLFHVKMYTAGDYYQVPYLKRRAKELFEDEVTQYGSWRRPVFLDAIYLVYDHATPDYREVRDDVVAVVQKHFGELQQNQEFVDMTHELGQFTMDLAKALYAKSARMEEAMANRKTYQCSSCPRSVNLDDLAQPEGILYYYRCRWNLPDPDSDWQSREH